MEKTVLVILIGSRTETAVTVQKILTGWGCIIKTRLGIHDGVLDACSQTGLIILELVGEEGKKDELVRKLSLVKNVAAKLVRLSLPD
jgi:hypothetical protein